MKFKILSFIVIFSVLLSLGACRETEGGNEQTSSSGGSSVTTSTGDNDGSSAQTTTMDSSDKTINSSVGTTVNQNESTSDSESDKTTTSVKPPVSTSDDYGYSFTGGELFMSEISVNGLPAIVGDSRNRIRIEKAGILNSNKNDPMFILVTNIGEEDIYSATLNASASGKNISFTVNYLPVGKSAWIESNTNYVYNASDNFTVKSSYSIVTVSSANIDLSRNYSGILEIYAGVQNGGKGVFVKNISGSEIKTVVIKYRPLIGSTGLFSSPYQVTIKSFADGNTIFKANSYIYDVQIEDVQIEMY